MSKKILLVGSGYMAEEYLKVLKHFACDCVVVARDAQKAKKVAAIYGYDGFGDGIKTLSTLKSKEFDWVINAVSIASLKDVTLSCLEAGFSKILIEKPGALNEQQLLAIKSAMDSKSVLKIAYNRRYYNATLKLKEMIERDGGILGCFFDFTDRQKDVLNNPIEEEVLQRWGIANASHVIDLAFYLIGLPKELNVLQDGSWDCHPSGNMFAGSGRSDKCIFSYFSAWAGGGRWSVEIATKEGRYKLSPMEELAFCKKDQFGWENIAFDDNQDKEYKPGLYKLVKDIVMDEQQGDLPDIPEQILMNNIVSKIFNYEN